MGGLIAVGVIRENGRLETVVGHTNLLPKTFKNEVFVDGDISALEAYVQHFGAFQLNRQPDGLGGYDDEYGPSEPVPSEYGFVLFDLKEKTILSAQNYTSVTTISGPSVDSDGAAKIVSGRISYDADGGRIVTPVGPYGSAEGFLADTENDPRKGVPTFGEFLDEVMAIMPDYRPEPGSGLVGLMEAAVDKLSPEEGRALLERFQLVHEVSETMPSMFSFEMDFRDWNVFDGGRNSEDFETIRDYLAERGYLNEATDEVWTSEIARLRAAGEEPALEEYPLPAPSY